MSPQSRIAGESHLSLRLSISFCNLQTRKLPSETSHIQVHLLTSFLLRPTTMSIAAFYHSGAKGEALPQNPRLVPPERLQALGWQLKMLAGNDIKTQASEIAQQFGQTAITNTIHFSISETIQNAQSVS